MSFPRRESTEASALRVGLTGGVASGKSTVAQLFAGLGAPVIDADQVARELTQPGTPLLQEIVRRFGAASLERLGIGLLRTDGSLDRSALRRLVFEDPGQRRELETLLHPRIRERMDALGRQSDGPYQIHVVPLLVETGGRGRFDRVLLVDCAEELQLARLQARDGIDLERAHSMLAAQAPRGARLTAADDLITNDGGPERLPPQVAVLDRKYRELAARRR